ncbi:hypothetical protein [Streptomyces sp. NPDC001480]|uniref:hypothetical protein n=1 Tax=Streptomyces sp. NPDC001480 TaxID=3364577 RepID=UPI0036BE80E5
MTTRTLAGRYRLGKLIGQGGMGQVWYAWGLLLERQVAVKVLHGGVPGGEGALVRERDRPAFVEQLTELLIFT